MQKIIYGTDTGSIEDYDQCTILLVSDDAAMDDLREGADPYAMNGVTEQTLATWEDIRDSFLDAMLAEGIDYKTRERVLMTVLDAIDNND